MKQQLQTHVRYMVRTDCEEVLEIAQLQLMELMSEEELLTTLSYSNVIGLVAVHESGVVGYMVYCIESDYIQVLNMAVHPSCERVGIASQLLAKVQRKVGEKRKFVVAFSGANNARFQSFLASRGFKLYDKLFVNDSEVFEFRFFKGGDA